MNRQLTEYKKEHRKAVENISTYIYNPINAYLLTKRLTMDWKSIEASLPVAVGLYNSDKR